MALANLTENTHLLKSKYNQKYSAINSSLLQKMTENTEKVPKNTEKVTKNTQIMTKNTEKVTENTENRIKL